MLLFVLLLEILTNADVVKLAKAGLSAETIEAKIAASETKFDTSTDALVALADQGVPDRVIRVMIAAAPAPPAAPTPPAPPTPGRTYSVAIHRDVNARCNEGELRVDGRGVKGSRCRALDFELAWNDVRKVCYDYGFRGTIVFDTAAGDRRISTTTPAEAKKIVEHIQKLKRVATVARCP